MLISQAHAQISGGGGASFLVQLLPFVVIFGIFYLLLIRPQQKRRSTEKMRREERNEQLRAERLSAGESVQSVSSGPSRKAGKSKSKSSDRPAKELFLVEEFVENPPTSEELYLVSHGGKYRVVAVTHHTKFTNMKLTAGNPNMWLVFMVLDDKYRTK